MWLFHFWSRGSKWGDSLPLGSFFFTLQMYGNASVTSLTPLLSLLGIPIIIFSFIPTTLRLKWNSPIGICLKWGILGVLSPYWSIVFVQVFTENLFKQIIFAGLSGTSRKYMYKHKLQKSFLYNDQLLIVHFTTRNYVNVMG